MCVCAQFINFDCSFKCYFAILNESMAKNAPVIFGFNHSVEFPAKGRSREREGEKILLMRLIHLFWLDLLWSTVPNTHHVHTMRWSMMNLLNDVFLGEFVLSSYWVENRLKKTGIFKNIDLRLKRQAKDRQKTIYILPLWLPTTPKNKCDKNTCEYWTYYVFWSLSV